MCLINIFLQIFSHNASILKIDSSAFQGAQGISFVIMRYYKTCQLEALGMNQGLKARILQMPVKNSNSKNSARPDLAI